MPHSFGLRARTRDMFKRGFKQHGNIHLSTYLQQYKVGDIVDIKANAAQQKGMPHKYYQGRTGVVFNVTPNAVGVIIYKIVNGRYMEKKVNLRIEHVRHSKCRLDFINRVKQNAALKAQAKADGKIFDLKRSPAMPKPAMSIECTEAPETLRALPYETYI